MTPSHNYNAGTFTISLNVQAANGCSFDTTQTQTFNKTAALTNLVQAAVCENGGVITLTAPTVTNGANWNRSISVVLKVQLPMVQQELTIQAFQNME